MGMTNGKRAVLLVVHGGKPQALSSARFIAERLIAAGLTVRVLSPEAAELRLPCRGRCLLRPCRPPARG